MSWSKNANPEMVKAYNRLYYLRKIKKKREQELQNLVKECPVCHKTFKPETKGQKYCCEDCKKQGTRIRELLRRQTPEYQEKLKEYRQSESYKAVQKKYRQTEKFKEYKRKYQKKYYQLQKERKQAEEYRQTEECKATVKKVKETKRNNLEH